MSSVREHCPEAERIVVLVDRPDGYFDPTKEDFVVIESSALDIANRDWFHFKYTILELSTALKPFAIDYLFRKFGAERVIYFDPDIKLYSGLDHLLGLLDSANAVLTPHLTDSLRGLGMPRDIEILRAGAYNLGFIALRKSDETLRLVSWWSDKLYDQCVIDLAQGLFVDQKWMDLVPGLFDHILVTRSPRYNVAYWNIQHRRITRAGHQWMVNGEPLCFFHFSGYDPRQPDVFSRHQTRYRLDELGLTAEIVNDYGRELASHGHPENSAWPYSYACFENGVPIPDPCRPVHHESGAMLDEIPNPFSDAGFDAFVAIWNSRVRLDRAITRLAYRVFKLRPDVWVFMPDVFESNRWQFLEWFMNSGRFEHSIDPIFTKPIEDALAEEYERRAREAAHAQMSAAPIPGAGEAPLDRMLHIYASRPDLQRAFPDPTGADEIAFLAWTISHGSREHRLRPQDRTYFEKLWSEKIARFSAPQRLAQRARLGCVRLALSLGIPSFRPAEPVPPEPAAKQVEIEPSIVNLVGYASATTGVGQSVRSARTAFESSGFQTRIVKVELDGRWDPADLQPHAPSVFYINADQSIAVMKAMNGAARIAPRIGYWAWELESFSRAWMPCFDLFDEIWTPSSFCTSAMAKISPKPVISVPHPISVDDISDLKRSDFGLPGDEFVFLTAFDMLSVFQRKNPLASIAAFRRAFSKHERVRLMIKVNNAGSDPQNLRRLQEAAAADDRISMLDACLSRSDMNALLACCDCFVSLHRSEGFGLMLAEAMWLGKPVLATGYSGNMDFTRFDNAFLVGYDLVRVGAGSAPYDPDEFWAEPRIADAAAQLQIIYEDAGVRAARAAEGQKSLRALLSPQRVGGIVAGRLRVRGIHPPRGLASSASTT